ncbi:rubrerythrin family protein [Halocatena pleomorpha]|uniref:Rubrerythrin family protein n=1 Tax=Halocatena pleomorpha TaxID=1785090 RepID=A0A3P3RHN6_9EURY|nr:rubrerythrin family protein [Halocatena pleomorpha]RRJ33077.1 rubrerythrin family protein [Halocatena pleomorpha]
MTGSAFIETVRDRNKTALSRLGSSKALYADTAGELEPETVLRAVATAEHAAMETFESWRDAESGRAAEAFADSASEEQDHYETVSGLLDDPDDDFDGTVPAIQSYLRDREETVERIGAFVGRTIAAEKSKEQVTAFFVGQADPQTAGTFRELKSDLEEQLDRAGTLIEAYCETDEEREQAREAASGAIQTAYEEYTDQLESMGVNPKPVC